MNPLIDQVVSWIIVFSGSLIPAAIIVFLIGLTGLKEITIYEEHNTFFYRLNPVTKFVFLIAIIVLVSTTIWWISAIFSLILLFSFLTLKDGVRRFFYASFLFVSTVLGGTWDAAPFLSYQTLQMAFPNQNFTAIWVFPSYFTVMGYDRVLTLQALLFAFQVSFRMAAPLLSSLLFVMTTGTAEIFRMFSKVKIPIPITFSVLVGVRTIPRIFELLDTSIKMQYIRGLGYGKPRFIQSLLIVEAIFLAIVPTIVYLFKGAKNMGISAATRGFMAYPKRTSLEEPEFTKLDYYFLVVIALIIIVAIIANILGFGRAIPTNGGW